MWWHFQCTIRKPTVCLFSCNNLTLSSVPNIKKRSGSSTRESCSKTFPPHKDSRNLCGMSTSVIVCGTAIGSPASFVSVPQFVAASDSLASLPQLQLQVRHLMWQLIVVVVQLWTLLQSAMDTAHACAHSQHSHCDSA